MNTPVKPHRLINTNGPAIPAPRLPGPDIRFEKVTVNDIPRWMWRTEGGHGILAPRDPRIVETPEGYGLCTVPLPGFTVGLLNLRDQFGSTPDGKMFRYTLVEGWPDA